MAARSAANRHPSTIAVLCQSPLANARNVGMSHIYGIRVHAGAMVDCGESGCRRIVERDAAILAEAAATGGTVVVDIPVDEIADRCRPCGDLVEWELVPGVVPPVAMPACKSGCTLAGSVDVIHF